MRRTSNRSRQRLLREEVLSLTREFVPAATYNKKLTLFVVKNLQVMERHGY